MHAPEAEQDADTQQQHAAEHAQAIAIQDLVLVAVDQAEHYWIAAEHTHAVDKQYKEICVMVHQAAQHKHKQHAAEQHAINALLGRVVVLLLMMELFVIQVRVVLEKHIIPVIHVVEDHVQCFMARLIRIQVRLHALQPQQVVLHVHGMQIRELMLVLHRNVVAIMVVQIVGIHTQDH